MRSTKRWKTTMVMEDRVWKHCPTAFSGKSQAKGRSADFKAIIHSIWYTFLDLDHISMDPVGLAGVT
jgi:hypothetical protein